MKPEPRYDVVSVRKLFDEMARTYGVVNLVASFGFAALWRYKAIRVLPPVQAACVVDLMSGMGELWHSLSHHIPASSRVIGVDISPEMTRRARKDFPFAVTVCLEDVLTWEGVPGGADWVVSSFGLKTFDRIQQEKLAACVVRLLRPGGSFSFVEISVPRARALRSLYMFYLKRVIPLVGRLFLGNPANYRMLGVYTEAFGDCDHFRECLENVGLQVRVVRYFFGCATGVLGTKAQEGE